MIAVLTMVLALTLKTLGQPLWVAVLVTIALGAFMGAVNGALVSYLRIPAFIVTLAGMSAYKGLALTVPPGSPIFSLSPDLGNLFYGQVFGVPLPFFYVVGLYTVATVMLNYTKFGREIYALGGNEVAARLSGVQVKWVRMLAYVAAGACTGIGGVLLAARLNSGSPNYGSGIELLAIAGAVVGGASLAGGRGHIVNTLVGTLIIVVVQNGLNLNAVSTSVQSVAIGAIILLAVALDIWRPTVSARVAELLPTRSPSPPHGSESRNEPTRYSHDGLHRRVEPRDRTGRLRSRQARRLRRPRSTDPRLRDDRHRHDRRSGSGIRAQGRGGVNGNPRRGPRQP